LFHGQAINYRKDGSEFMMEWKIAPIRNEKDEITHYLAIQRDVRQ
jgi:PAS domain S-box-containing protein